MLQKWTLAEFRKEYKEHIKEYGAGELSLNTFFFENQFNLPSFPEKLFDQTVSFRMDTISPSVKMVDVNDLRGNSWVFKNETPDGKPRVSTLVSIFLENQPDKITAIPVNKLPNNLYSAGSDGNHRIYAAFLRGTLIKVKVWG